MDTSGTLAGIVCRELEPRLWPQLEALFGVHGACGGCWCWHWRLAEGEHWDDVKGEVAHERLHQAVQSGSVHGKVCRGGLVRRMFLHPAWLEAPGAGGAPAGKSDRGNGA